MMIGGFWLIQIESFGEMLKRKALERLPTKQEADEKVERIVSAAPQSGFNEEQGYWWCRHLSAGKSYRYVVAAA